MTPVISIVIATFNSEKVLPKVLAALGKQTYPRNRMEIIAVDGGSVDSTLRLCKQFGCRIIVNPRTEPVYGKFLAYTKARGRYLMYLDHDEVLENNRSIENRITVLIKHGEAKAIGGGNYVSPMGCPFVTKYINEFGDPFSFFIYRISKSFNFYFSSMRSKYAIAFENKSYGVFDFSGRLDLPITELVAGGAMFDAQTLKKEFPDTKRQVELLLHSFYLLNSKHPYLIVMKNDPITHYSSDTYSGYFKKLKWRVKNNIFFQKELGVSGFTGRQRYQSMTQNLKRYLYLPYALSVVLPAIDGLILSISRRDARYFAHVYLTLYMACIIIYYYLLKLSGFRPKLLNYDESKVVKNL